MRPIRPSCRVEPVRVKICQPTTTATIWKAAVDRVRASQKRRKAGWRSSGGRWGGKWGGDADKGAGILGGGGDRL